MRNISDNLKNILENNYLNLAKCFKITLSNSEVIGLTEYSKDINIDNITYISSSYLNEDSNNFNNNLSSNLSEVVGLVDSNIIDIHDVVAGKFDNAKVEIFYVNLDDDNLEKIKITTGNIISINITDSKVSFNISNILSILDKTIGDVYSPLCRASFCDNKCSLNIENYTFESKITYIKSDTEFLCSNTDISSKDKDYFKYGILTFTSGKNAGQSMEIKQSFDNDIVLNSKLSYELTVGDTFNIIAGCDKNMSTCSGVFSNAVNFRGEPDISSTSKVYKFY